MPDLIYDRVCETSTTTGTGDLTLLGAIAGYQGFWDAGLRVGDTFDYLIEGVDSNGVATGQWEVGVGGIPSMGSMSRAAVYNGSGGPASLVDFIAGTKRVHLAAPAYLLGFKGAVAIRGADLNAQNLTTSTALPWTATAIDTDPIDFTWVIGSPTRITLPPTAQWTVRLSGEVQLSGFTANEWCELKIRQNGTTVIGRRTHVGPTTAPTFQIDSKIIRAAASDYFELMVQVQADTSVNVLQESFFQLEILQ